MRRIVILALLLSVVGGGLFFIFRSQDRTVKEAEQGMAEHGMTTGWKFTLPKGDPIQGRTIFVEVECYKCHEVKCHEVKGEKFPAVAKGEKGVGPELSQMARMHPVEFFAESIINPNAAMDPDAKEKGYLGADGKSKMPDFGDILTIKQVADLAAYLTSLKGQEHKTQ